MKIFSYTFLLKSVICGRNEKGYQLNLQTALPRCAPQVLFNFNRTGQPVFPWGGVARGEHAMDECDISGRIALDLWVRFYTKEYLWCYLNV